MNKKGIGIKKSRDGRRGFLWLLHRVKDKGLIIEIIKRWRAINCPPLGYRLTLKFLHIWDFAHLFELIHYSIDCLIDTGKTLLSNFVISFDEMQGPT
jgi:hypothetical protein